LQIFSTSEFGLVELADRHTRISIIMPQKKNPYSLAYLRGLCGEMIGLLASMAAVGKTPSGQIDNRIFAYGDIPRALAATTQAVQLMASVLRGVTVNKDRAAERTAQDFIGATDLAEVIMLKTGLDYKAAHDLVSRAVRLAIESGATTLTPDGLKAAGLDSPAITPELIAETLDPANIVQTRTGPGGAAEASLNAMIGECRATLQEHAQWRAITEARLQMAEAQLLMMATALQAGHVTQPPVPEPAATPEEEPKPQSWEEAFYAEFKDLPQPPKRRRRDFDG